MYEYWSRTVVYKYRSRAVMYEYRSMTNKGGRGMGEGRVRAGGRRRMRGRAWGKVPISHQKANHMQAKMPPPPRPCPVP